MHQNKAHRVLQFFSLVDTVSVEDCLLPACYRGILWADPTMGPAGSIGPMWYFGRVADMHLCSFRVSCTNPPVVTTKFLYCCSVSTDVRRMWPGSLGRGNNPSKNRYTPAHHGIQKRKKLVSCKENNILGSCRTPSRGHAGPLHQVRHSQLGWPIPNKGVRWDYSR